MELSKVKQRRTAEQGAASESNHICGVCQVAHIVLDETPSIVEDGEAAEGVAAHGDALHVRPASSQPLQRFYALHRYGSKAVRTDGETLLAWQRSGAHDKDRS